MNPGHYLRAKKRTSPFCRYRYRQQSISKYGVRRIRGFKKFPFPSPLRVQSTCGEMEALNYTSPREHRAEDCCRRWALLRGVSVAGSFSFPCYLQGLKDLCLFTLGGLLNLYSNSFHYPNLLHLSVSADMCMHLGGSWFCFPLHLKGFGWLLSPRSRLKILYLQMKGKCWRSSSLLQLRCYLFFIPLRRGKQKDSAFPLC